MRSAPTLRAWTYGYDLAGNLTSQTDGQGQTLWFGYDPLHRLTEQRLNNGSGTPLASYGYDTGVNGLSRQTFAASHSTTLNDTFDALNTHTWVLQDASLDAGAMKTAGVWTGVCCYSSIYRPTYGLSPTAPSQSVQLEFKLNGNNADLYAHFMLEASSTPYVRFGIIATGNRIFVQYTTDGVNWIYPPADLINAIEVGAWYVLRLKVLPFGKGSIEVWNRDQPAQRGNSLVDMPNGLTYRFHHWMGNGTSWIDNYTELTDVTSAWSYDARGRATQEDKNLGAIGSWTTRYTYDAMDRMVSTIHPTSEAVSTGYDAGGRPVSLTSLHAGNTTPLISGAGYNALGQPTVITAGNGLTTRYVYWGLDNFAPGYPNFAYGRLRQVCVTANPTCPLGSTTGTYLNLAYNYDHVGNVITLRDDTGGQREDFSYDALDRLTGAVPNPLGVPQTIGDYTETYGYNVIGNLVSKAGVALTYTSTKPHAVTALSNGATFVYDGNGNMTQRVEVSTTQRVTYTQVWDVNNRLQAVLQDQASVHFAYDAAGLRAHKTEYAHGAALFSDTFDVANSAAWTFGPSSTVPFAGDGNPVWRNLGAEAYRESWRNSYNLVNGDSASVDFRVNAANTYLYLMLESDRNGPNHSRWAVFAHDNRLSVQYRLNGGDWLYQWGLLNPLKTNTWYRLTLRVDEANGFRIEVRERDGCSSTGACGASYSNFMPAGKSWRFSTAIYRGESWLDNYVERNDRTAQVRSISPAYEYLLAGGVVTRTFYYTFGGTRVAMRVFTSWPGTLYWLHGDHLGSASLTTNSSGQPIAQLRYSPFGETRWANPSASATPTDRRFTGQRQENAGAVGSLYDYGARVYSPLLGRFLSADSLVPQPGDPQSLNRYSYALDNPLKYTDPTGHDVACAGRDASECGTGGGATPSWTDMYQSSVTGIRVPQPGTYLAPRDGYQSAIAANYASQGYVHWAELIEVGHLCAACHVTHNDGSIPTDEELDLSTYNFWAKESALETSAIGVVTSLGSSYVSLRASARLNPNAIGRWGEQQVGQELPVEVRQIRVVDKMTGQVRIYDGQFVAVEGAYVEVKTSVRGVVTLRPEIRAEIAFDANMAEKPMWIFVNARPSSGVMGALQQAGVPWHVLHVR